MHLIQVFLPLYDNQGKPFNNKIFASILVELKEKFGGITAYTKAPATGLWKEDDTTTIKDDILTYEILAPELQKSWWKEYKSKLEKIFKQDEIHIRTWVVDVL